MRNNYKILAINPGSTTTKLAYYENGELKFRQNVFHPVSEIGDKTIIEQLEARSSNVAAFLKERDIEISGLDMITARGASLPNLKNGAYEVDEVMVDYLNRNPTAHASMLGCLIAYRLGKPHNIPCIIYDSVSADDYMPEAKVSGLKECPNHMVSHVLNGRMVCIKAAQQLGKDYSDCNFIVAHIGGGSSISAHGNGEIVDSVTNDRGPMSPERSGQLSVTKLVDLCYSGKYSHKEMHKMVMGKGGMVSLLGTSDMRAVMDRFAAGDAAAVEAVGTMAYQHAKAITSMLAPLRGKIDGVIFTGGVSNDEKFVEEVRRYIEWLPIFVFPGEYEMEGLISGALRVLNGEEQARKFKT